MLIFSTIDVSVHLHVTYMFNQCNWKSLQSWKYAKQEIRRATLIFNYAPLLIKLIKEQVNRPPKIRERVQTKGFMLLIFHCRRILQRRAAALAVSWMKSRDRPTCSDTLALPVRLEFFTRNPGHAAARCWDTAYLTGG